MFTKALRCYRELGCIALLLLSFQALASNYTEREDVQQFIESLVNEHGFNQVTVEQVLEGAEHREDIIALITKPAEKKPWIAYRKIFVTPSRIEGGIAFARQHMETLLRAQDEFGAPPEVVTAIIGVETNYGSNMGSHRVLDALATLGFDYPPRSSFFRSQLGEFFVIACEERLTPFHQDDACERTTGGQTLDSSVAISDLKGSYAGAMGYGQFIPSSYRHFAIDFNGDGKRDIWNDVEDAIGSVASYFKEHGWISDGLVIEKVQVVANKVNLDTLANENYQPNKSLATWRELGIETELDQDELMASLFRYETEEGMEYYLGFQNFYSITRYNISRLYAKAVYELADSIVHELP